MVKNPESIQITSKYCRIEFIVTTIWCGFLFFCTVAEVVVIFFVPFNEFGLTLNFYITIIPLNGSTINWTLNYIYQVFLLACVGTFFVVFFPVTFVLMNHICLEVETTIIHVMGIDRVLKNSPNQRNLKVKMHLRDLVIKAQKIQSWQKSVQDLLAFNFLFEYSALAIIFAAFLFSTTKSYSSSLVDLLVPFVFATRLYANSWMGSRLVTKMGTLTTSLTDINWDLLTGKERKDLQLVILMAQDMKGFNGIFMQVNLETFKEV